MPRLCWQGLRREALLHPPIPAEADSLWETLPPAMAAFHPQVMLPALTAWMGARRAAPAPTPPTASHRRRLVTANFYQKLPHRPSISTSQGGGRRTWEKSPPCAGSTPTSRPSMTTPAASSTAPILASLEIAPAHCPKAPATPAIPKTSSSPVAAPITRLKALLRRDRHPQWLRSLPMPSVPPSKALARRILMR